MMKIITKFLVVALAFELMMPGLVYAQGGFGQPDGKGIGQGNFCAKVGNIKIDRQIAQKVTQLQSNYQSRLTKMTEQRERHTDQLETKRERWENTRGQRFEDLNDEAETDAQKAAVEKFITAITAAVKARQAAVDKAITAFRSGVDQAFANRRSALVTAVDNYYKAVKAALDKAKADCAGDSADDATIRAAFVNALKTARTKFQSEKQAMDKLGTKIQELNDAKKEAIKEAVDIFKEAVETARTEMLKAFPDETEETEEEAED